MTSWTVTHQAPLSMDFSRQEYWNGLPFPSPGDLPDKGCEPGSPALLADSLPSELPGKPIYFLFLPTSEWKLKINMKVKTPGKKKSTVHVQSALLLTEAESQKALTPRFHRCLDKPVSECSLCSWRTHRCREGGNWQSTDILQAAEIPTSGLSRKRRKV